MSDAASQADATADAEAGAEDTGAAEASDAYMAADAPEDAPEDVLAASDASDGPIDAPADREAGTTFSCPYAAGGTCDRTTQYCYSSSGPSIGCVAEVGDASSVLIPPACVGSATCSCFGDAGFVTTFPESCHCSDTAGGLFLNCPCYGSPPARLERLARVA
jgi:hypothetical protein